MNLAPLAVILVELSFGLLCLAVALVLIRFLVRFLASLYSGPFDQCQVVLRSGDSELIVAVEAIRAIRNAVHLNPEQFPHLDHPSTAHHLCMAHTQLIHAIDERGLELIIHARYRDIAIANGLQHLLPDPTPAESPTS